MDLAEEWVELGGVDRDNIAKQIAELLAQGDGNRVVLVAWGDAGEYIQAAVDEDGIFLDVGPEVGQYIQKGDIEFLPINEHFLKNQLETGVDRVDFVRDDMYSVIESPDRQVRESYRAKEIRWLLENADDYGYELIGNSWIKR